MFPELQDEEVKMPSLSLMFEMNTYKAAIKEILVVQTCDGAAVMASCLNGLQAKVKQVAPNIIFVHCYGHILNLVSLGGKMLA